MANLTAQKKKNGNRTTYHDADEGGLHVATIIEQGKPSKDDRGRVVEGCYQWFTAHNGGHCGFFDDAEDEIRMELDK